MLKNIKLVSNYDGTYDIIVEYDNYDVEFGLDFDDISKFKSSGEKIKEFVKEKSKKFKISCVRIMMSGVLVATMALSTFMSTFSANGRYNMGYLYSGTDQQHIEYVDRTNGVLDTVSPSYFDIQEDGSLKLNYLSEHLISTMHSKGIKVVPFLSNHWNREAGINALKDIETLSTKVAENVEKYNLDGVNVDIENVTHEQRQQYTNFVRLLREKIPSDKEVSVAVAANPNDWQTGWHGSYDYAELSKYADHLLIMAYDEHYEGGTSGPVASIDFVENSIKYALTKTSANKIVVGIPLYGRVWSLDNNGISGKGVSIEVVNDIVKNCDATVTYDENSDSVKAEFEIKEGDKNYVVGGDIVLKPGKYEVWYENDESYSSKLNLVSKYDLKGAGSWSLGQEDPSIWDDYDKWINGSADDGITEDDANQDDTNSDISKPEDDKTEESNPPEDNGSQGTPPKDEVTNPPEDNNSQDTPPKDEVTDTPSTSTPTEPSPEYVVHNVKSGDTLWKIAKKYLGSGTLYPKIKELNNLSSDKIYPGMKLKIPVLESGGSSVPDSSDKKYVVKKGDTLWKIAKKHLGSGSRYVEIKKLNGLTSDTIYPGQILKLPV